MRYARIPTIDVVVDVANCPIETVIKKHFNWKEYQDLLKVYRKENESICILEIPHGKKEDNLYTNIYSILKPAGVIASPFEIAKFLASKNEMKGEINNRQLNFRHFTKINEKDFFEHNAILKKLLPSLPNNIIDLKNHKLMIELASLAINNKSPVKYLAAYLHRMISSLDEKYNIDIECIQRVSLFLSFAVKFHNQHYDRFAFLTHAINHEILLILEQANKSGIEIINYQQFKDCVDKNFISSFTLQIDEKAPRDYQTISAPANSGCHAFLMSFELAKKMKQKITHKPVIEYYAPLYYEFQRFMHKDVRYTNGYQIADIYLISAGPMGLNPEGVATTVPGTDINAFVEHLLDVGLANHDDGVVILVDTTTALKKNLVLNDTTKKLIEAGKISLICHESYQKFGLAHTDQIQGGIVYGLCSKKSFDNIVIDEFEKNADNDLRQHLDMQMASFIQENAGHYLEAIKESHFENGELIKKYFGEFDYNKLSKKINYTFMLGNESFSIHIDKDTNPGLYDAALKNLEFRQGFGHFNTTICPMTVDKSIRLSAGASDKIDNLILITQLKLFSLFSHDQLISILKLLIEKINKEMFIGKYEILLTGLLMAIKNACAHAPEFNEDEKLIFLNGINELMKYHTKLVSGRKSFQTLYSFMLDPIFFEFKSNSLSEYLNDLSEDKKIMFIEKLQERKRLQDIITGGYQLNEVIKSSPTTMQYNLACQFSSLINTTKILSLVMNSLADADKYPFIKHVVETDLKLALNYELLLDIIKFLPQKNDALHLIRTANVPEAAPLNVDTLISIAEFFKDEPSITLEFLNKFHLLLKKSSTQNPNGIKQIQEKITFYSSMTQRLFSPAKNEESDTLTKSTGFCKQM